MLRMRLPLLAVTLGLAAASATTRAQQNPLPLWPHGTPEPAQTTAPETDLTKPADSFISGHRTARLTNVTEPTLTVFPAHGHATGAATIVFPGGGYRILAWDGEGLDACAWVNSVGMTCILVKYRVPEPRFPTSHADLEDAQQAIRLTRAHAAEWHIDPQRIGVMGFSAGANLAVLLCTHPDDTHITETPAAQSADTTLSALPNFAILAYPAYLALPPQETTLDPIYTPTRDTPQTFLIQAKDDTGYGKNAIVYYRALMDAGIPSELHYYATGGHGFGMHPIGMPEEHWPHLAEAWLRSIHVLPPAEHHNLEPSTGTPTSPMPCAAVTQPPTPGKPDKPNASTTNDPNCP
jgi:acetyl esterase/lipase